MNELKTLSVIKKLISYLFNESFDQIEAEKRLNKIHSHFQQITDISGYDVKIEHMAAIPTAKGKALGLNYAAQCLLDYKRTVKFLKAIVSIILEKKKEKPEKLITIFYSGCGPYAPFITLVAPFFKPEEVQFSLLEINEASLISAKKLINHLQLADYIKEYYLADAVTFKVPNANTYDLLISETLDALLFRECYVPILFNLLPQFNKNIVLIPENVLIDVSFFTNENTTEKQKEYKAGTVFNVREAVASSTNSNSIPSHFPDKKIDLKNLDLFIYDKILLDTKVHIHNDSWLERNESSLTIPLEIVLEKPFSHNALIFTYYLEPEIELKCTFQ